MYPQSTELETGMSAGRWGWGWGPKTKGVPVPAVDQGWENHFLQNRRCKIWPEGHGAGHF